MNNRIAGYIALERLEPCAGKLACTVLRGASSSNAAGLLDFTFVGRQVRITIDEKHFKVDLVFFNRLLRCFVIIDLKIGELTHQDLGQMQMYVNYYDRFVRLPEENKTIGIVICKDKSNALVEITLPEGNDSIFASRFQTVLPDKQTLINLFVRIEE